MNQPVKPREVQEAEAAERNYLFLALTALVILLLLLLRRGLGGWSLLPVLMGLAGVTLRWRAAPLLVLGFMAGLIYANEPVGLRRSIGTGPNVLDWVMAGAMLAYFAAHYRLQSLTLGIFPADRRREVLNPPANESAVTGRARSAGMVAPAEIGWLVLTLPLYVALAQGYWLMMPTERVENRLPPQAWRGITLIWGLGLVLFGAAALLGYLGRRGQSAREARVYLQDVLWQETRREQRRLERWRQWLRTRQRRSKQP